MPYFILLKTETATRINFEPALLRDPADPCYYADWYALHKVSPDTLCPCCGLSVHAPGSERVLHGSSHYYCEPCALEGIAWRHAWLDDRDSPPPQCTHAHYMTRQEALPSCDAKTHTIVLRPTLSELNTWETREQNRVDRGEYIAVPWAGFDSYPVHHVHMSVDKPGYVAFTRDIEAGLTDKQTRMRPGRYLQEFYADKFTASEIAHYVAQCEALGNATYALATTAKDITAIYSGKGPSSCMTIKSPAEYSWQKAYQSGALPEHPCAVYAGGDLALAYTGDIAAVKQRAFVWPERKISGRIYGTGPLSMLLKRDGYTEGSFSGARLRAVAIDNGEFITPYVDAFMSPGRYTSDSANFDKNYLILTGKAGNGDIALDHTNGHSGDVELAGEAEDDSICCHNCSEGENRDDACGYLGYWYCRSCYHDLFARCAHCNDTVSVNDTETVANGETWCDRCISDETQKCFTCIETWIERTLWSRVQREREARGMTDYCVTCAESMLDCPACHDPYDVRDHATCPCGAQPRCTETLPLPLAPSAYVYDNVLYRLAADEYAHIPDATFEVWQTLRPGCESHNDLSGVDSSSVRGVDCVTCSFGGHRFKGIYRHAVAVMRHLQDLHGATCTYQIVYVVPTVATVNYTQGESHASV